MIFPASYSKLSTYEKCPDQAKYKYVLKMREPKGPAAERGSALHSSAEAYLLGEKTTIRKELIPIVKVLKETKKAKPDIERKIALTRGLSKVVDWYSELAWFRMVLDAVYPIERTVQVLEWKSGKVYDDHEDQRQLYAIGALVLHPKASEAVATTHYIDQRGLTTNTRMDRKRANLMAWHFNERLETMERDTRFGPRPGFYCRWCPFSRYKGGPCKAG